MIHVLSADRFSCMQMKFAMVVFRENCPENLVSSNHFSEIISTQNIKPVGATPVTIHIDSGVGNYILNNHVIVTEVHDKVSESCFSAHVEALLTTEAFRATPTPGV